MEATIRGKAVQAANAFLSRKGYEILEEGWAHGADVADIVAKDGDAGCLVIADVLVKDDGLDMPEEKPDRDKFERIAAAYLAGLDEATDFSIRYDIISILVINSGKALLRHHINALGTL
jgi:putative endonuclease